MISQSTRTISLWCALIASSTCAPVVIADCDSGSVCNCPDCPIERNYKQSHWHVIETENFKVSSAESLSRAENLAKHAEGLRSELRPKWLGQAPNVPWNPKCEIVLHAKLGSYVSAVGRGSERTVGSSLLKADNGKILRRRIDLLGGRTAFLTAALPHELTHVVVQERFAKTTMPRWADEGIAILADPESKQGRHRHDLNNAVANGTTFPAGALLTLGEYPRPDQFGVFYGQSASLTEFLVQRKTPEAFLEFIERANLLGYESALRTCYDITSIGELDRKWRDNSLASASK